MIYYVQSNLKHNGTFYAAGSYFVNDDSFPELVAAGVLKPVQGAADEAEAVAIIAQGAAEEAAAEAAAQTAEPANTWGPKPDAEPEPAPEEPAQEAAEKAAAAPKAKKGKQSITPPDETGDNL